VGESSYCNDCQKQEDHMQLPFFKKKPQSVRLDGAILRGVRRLKQEELLASATGVSKSDKEAV